jgi:hypothetical protein
MENKPPFNPLDKLNLAVSVADAMLEQEVRPLPPAERIPGAGIYAIYYTGAFPAYRKISEQNKRDDFSAPIYVGKAVPRGARKGGFELGDDAGFVLFDRLGEHAESIRLASNLNLKDFKCRYLVVDDIWIPLGESLMIQKFKPLWNHRVDGFGNHDPGGGRSGQKTQKDVFDEIKKFLDRPVPDEVVIKKPK